MGVVKTTIFNTTIIADNAFSKYNAYGETETYEDSSKYIKALSTSLSVPFGGGDNETFGLSFFLALISMICFNLMVLDSNRLSI